MLHLKQYQQPASFIGFMASAIALIAATTFVSNAKVASVATLAGTVSFYGYVKIEQENNQARLKDDLDTAQRTLSQLETALNECKASENNLLSKIKPYILPDGTMFSVSSQSELIASMRDNIARLGERLQASETSLLGVKGERSSLKLDLDRLNGQIASLESSKSHWSKEFDQMILENERLEKENNKFEAQFSSIEEVAKLRANAESRALEDKLKELNQEYTKVATLYNSAVTDLKKLNAEYVTEFSELNEAVSKGIPNAFEAVLNARDQELMRLSGHLSILIQPQYFESIGEFERANRLIKALYESEQPITLDASEIVPYSDQTGFDVYFNLRDRKARGQAFIDSLDDQGNQFSIICGCVKDLKFEYDRINPHRIKTAMVFRKASKKEPKAAIDKLWISASQFERVYKLLKKPMTRVMGSTGEGKGIFVNLLLALEANQSAPTFTRLHDPMNGSSQDYWQISKTSKGKAETTKAVKSFISEFDDRLESGISEPKTLDIFDEIDILADSDSSVNKAFLNSSKGMRHCGMRAYLIGQSPSVGKKGFEWADMDNFNAVYFGTAIITAIDKTPSLSTQSEALRKIFDRLKSFCDLQNEEGEFEEGNLYRVGLLVTSGKATFFELPSADSIVCDWSKLTTIETPKVVKLVDKVDLLECPECQSNNAKPYRGSHTNKDQSVTNYLKCSDCNCKFTVKDRRS